MDELGRLSPKQALEGRRLPVHFILEDIRSGLNVGSVLRTADAFALAEIVITGISPAPPHREILKTSLGAELSVPWRYESDIETVLVGFRESSTRIYALEQAHGAISLEQFDWDGIQPIAIVLGNEVRGVSPKVLELVDAALEIPQLGAKHSLNVSVAAGVVAWHLLQGKLKF